MASEASTEQSRPARVGNEASDRELVIAAQAGDVGAFELLVRRYQPPILGLARRMLGVAGDADRDAAQEILVKAYRSIGSADPERPFAPWLFTVAHNHLRDCLRRRKARLIEEPKREEGRHSPEDAVDPSSSAEAALDRTRTAAELEAAIGALPESYREVVVLHHVERLPVREIAEIIGRPQGTVMTWLYRARAALRTSLERRGVEP